LHQTILLSAQRNAKFRAYMETGSRNSYVSNVRVTVVPFHSNEIGSLTESACQTRGDEVWEVCGRERRASRCCEQQHLTSVGCMQISLAISFNKTLSLSFIFVHTFSRLKTTKGSTQASIVTRAKAAQHRTQQPAKHSHEHILGKRVNHFEEVLTQSPGKTRKCGTCQFGHRVFARV